MATVTPEPATFGLIFGGFIVVALKKRFDVRRQ
ncbi:MAG: PEP-CTERM sorting domain-containing protein [Acidobacteriota bacterium]